MAARRLRQIGSSPLGFATTSSCDEMPPRLLMLASLVNCPRFGRSFRVISCPALGGFSCLGGEASREAEAGGSLAAQTCLQSARRAACFKSRQRLPPRPVFVVKKPPASAIASTRGCRRSRNDAPPLAFCHLLLMSQNDKIPNHYGIQGIVSRQRRRAGIDRHRRRHSPPTLRHRPKTAMNR